MLQSDCDVVPCPKCGALTQAMKCAKASVVPQAFGGMGLGALTMLGTYAVGKWTGHWFVVIGLIGAVIFVLAGADLLAKLRDAIAGEHNHN